MANFFAVLLSAAGAFFAIRDIGTRAIPYLIAVVVFPLPYYLTHTLVRYRFPIEPLLTILCVYGFVRILENTPVMKNARAGD